MRFLKLALCFASPGSLKNFFDRDAVNQVMRLIDFNRYRTQNVNCLLTGESADKKEFVECVAAYLHTCVSRSTVPRWGQKVLYLTNLDSEFGPDLNEVSETAEDCPKHLIFLDWPYTEHVPKMLCNRFGYTIKIKNQHM